MQIADGRAPSVTSQPSKPQRILACVRCQQRKVKCDRKYPCANCVKSGVQCEQAKPVLARRKRRFPERELLARIQKYEDMLRQHDIEFEPLHKIPARDGSPSVEGGYESDDKLPKTAQTEASTPVDYAERLFWSKNVWKTINKESRDPGCSSESSEDDVRETVVKNTWCQLFENNDHLLFGSRKSDTVDISTLHPEPVQVFRLWQIYLENVNPLLKVIHAPSLQGYIIEATSKLSNIKPTLEALMFSIYCMSIISLTADDCQAMFASSRQDLLSKYQFGCQQALLKCNFLRCNDLDCLTALYLYLVSVRPSTVPQSLSSMLGVAIRIAQRMCIHSEAALANYTPLDAEIRRRLWWSLVLFDTRVSELADFKPTILNPIWDCRVPLNVNDSEFRPNMKKPPHLQGGSTEALFPVVCSELGEYTRNTAYYLNFTNPSLKPIAKDVQHGYTEYEPLPERSELACLEQMIENKYLRFCNQDNPLHLMTVWMARGHLAKFRFMEYHSKHSNSEQVPEAQREAAMSYALRMLECNSKIFHSPLTKGYRWLAQFYFPFPAYVFICKHLKRQPFSKSAERAWEVMSDNYDAQFGVTQKDSIPLLRLFSGFILQAWEAREAMPRQPGEPLVPPRIILSIRNKTIQMEQNPQNIDPGQLASVPATDVNNVPAPMPISYGGHNLLYGMGGQEGCPMTGPAMYPDMHGPTTLDFGTSQIDWSAMDWALGGYPGWGGGETTGLSVQPLVLAGTKPGWT
ncbi:hypothetical protein BGW36DRAFT_417877 [Talaromyces proteolyticus]|uniref:Zn(2)-C6 fungal-type domain-containing protein n=1 Tax=Talaromyces proteolyticus TaxID=1131652 RepID=A0AAD4PYN0_9EURO|nr:uncharacterized protein BGW36DRAFT_417877 [Talaromyces proteolyticus]KAH8694977.1 hypothetical protein BGW36DRAFT_417877 [Talaromyces proteolyticus]